MFGYLYTDFTINKILRNNIFNWKSNRKWMKWSIAYIFFINCVIFICQSTITNFKKNVKYENLEFRYDLTSIFWAITYDWYNRLMWKWFLILRFIWKYDLRFIYITHKSCAFSTILFLLLMAKIYILSCLYPQIHFLRKEWCFPLYREIICPSTRNPTNCYNNNLFTELFVI